MSLDDFCSLSPKEFAECCKAFHEQRDADDREAWDRMRILAAITINPHLKTRVTPQKLLPMPWDIPNGNKRKATPISKEESLKRLKRLMERKD